MNRVSEKGAAIRGILITLGVLIVIAAGFAMWLGFGPGPMDFAGGKQGALSAGTANPTGVPAELAGAGVIERGQYLARAADCVACHTAQGGQPFAGGRPFVLPFGTLYSTNITPDKKTGIGSYSDADWLRALHKGIGRDGTRLYPAMPYAAYTYMTDEDALAIKAYLLSLPPIEAPRPASTLSFPFNQRWLMAFWSGMFNPDERFKPNTERDAEWNRGAYLVEVMAHCGECHTPRTLAFSLDNRRKFAGAKQAGWMAYNISTHKETGIGEWAPKEIAQYIQSGHTPGRGSANGPMQEAVQNSLRYLTEGDISAIAAYVASVPAVKGDNQPAVKTDAASPDHSVIAAKMVDARGKEVYEGACASCHGWSGRSPILAYADLVGTRAVNDSTATNLVQMVLNGSSHEGMSGSEGPHGSLNMPDFGNAYSDTEVAAVANYVTARFGSAPSKVTASDVSGLKKEAAL